MKTDTSNPRQGGFFILFLLLSIQPLFPQSLEYSGQFCVGSPVDLYTIGGFPCGEANVAGPGSWQFSHQPSSISFPNSFNYNRVQVVWNYPVSGMQIRVSYTCSQSSTQGDALRTGIAVNASITPGVSLALSTSGVCQGTSVQLNASPTNGGSGPLYRFYVGSENVYSGPSSSHLLETGNLSPGNHSIRVLMTSSITACVTQQSVYSTFQNLGVAAKTNFSASITGPALICSDKREIDIHALSNGPGALTYEWLVNGSPSWDDNIRSVTASDGMQVVCRVHSDQACVNTPATSNIYIPSITQAIEPKVSIHVPKLTWCPGESMTLTAISSHGGAAYRWFVNGNEFYQGNPAVIPVAAAIAQNTYYSGSTIHVEATGLSGTCLTQTWAFESTNNIGISVNAPPAPGFSTGESYVCQGTPGYVYTTEPGKSNYQWIVSDGGTVTAGGGTTHNSVTVTWNSSIPQSVRVKYTDTNGCPALTPALRPVTVIPPPTTANAGPDQTGSSTCGQTVAYLAANTPLVGTGLWTIAGGVNGVLGNTSSPNATLTGIAGTNYRLRWTISNGPCQSSFDEVDISFSSHPTQADAGLDQTSPATCGRTAVTLGANAPPVGSGEWTIIEGQGGSILQPHNASSEFIGVPGSTYTLRWSTSNSPCPTSSDEVVVRLNALPSTSNAGVDQTGPSTCGATTVTLAGNIPVAGTGTWHIISGVGGTLANAANAGSAFTGVAGSTYVLRWVIASAPCPQSFDDVVISLNRQPSLAFAGPDQAGPGTCGVTSISLSAQPPGFGTGQWNIVEGTGGTVDNSLDPHTTFRGSPGGTYKLKWTVSAIPCGSSSDEMVITLNQNPSDANAGADITGPSTCGLTSVALSATSPAIGSGTWSILSGSGGTIAQPTISNSQLAGLSGSTYVARWTTSNSPCNPGFDDVTVTFNEKPGTEPTVSGNVRFGQGTLQLTAGGAGPGENYRWLTASGVQHNGPGFQTDIVHNTVTGYGSVQIIGANSCAGSQKSIDLIVYPLPEITAQTTHVYRGSKTLLTVGEFDSYLWINSTNQVLSTLPYLETGIPDTYSVTVTRNGASATSSQFKVKRQFEGQPANLVAAYDVRFKGIHDPRRIELMSADSVSQVVQYFDGLGRLLQHVATQASPDKEDIVTPSFYDELGREARKYLPFTSEGNGWYKSGVLDSEGNPLGPAIDTYNTGGDNIADDPMPYSQSVFDSSPADKLILQGSPGEAWQPNSGHAIRHDYRTNAFGEVLLFKYDQPSGLLKLSTPPGKRYYQPHTLFAHTVWDEDDRETIVFSDKAGRTVCSKVKAGNGEYASTYYIYNDLGSLAVVLPPQGVVEMPKPTRKGMNAWAFQYQYDSRGRMIARKVPGAGWAYMIYDKRDRLVLTQDARQRKKKTWSFIKYDILNRPVLSGIRDTTVALAQSQMQEVVDLFYDRPKARWGEEPGPGVHGYTNHTYPVLADPEKYLTVTYYDNYSFRDALPGGTRLEYSNDLPAEHISVNEGMLTGLVTGAKVKVLDGVTTGGSTWLSSATYYDDRHRLVQNISDNLKGGTDRSTHALDFNGKLLKSITVHTESDPTWIERTGISVTGNKIIKVASGNGWNAGASSGQYLPAHTDGWIEMEFAAQEKRFAFGFNDTSPDAVFKNIDYAIHINKAALQVFENNVLKATLPSTLVTGDIIRVERSGTTIHYKRNGIIIYTSLKPSNTSLVADISMFTRGGTLKNVYTSFSTISHKATRRMEYDHAGRLLRTWYQLDQNDEILLSQNDYNSIGQLIDKKIHSTNHGADFAQSLDYRYNIRGWLTSMNGSSLEAGVNNDDHNDLFGLTIAYDDGSAGTPQFNGNISEMSWSNNLGLSQTTQHRYVYSYDMMSRIKAASFQARGASWFDGTASACSESGYKYDQNGNILAFSRRGADNRVIDSLLYDYGTGAGRSNLLIQVTDAADPHKGFVDGFTSGPDYSYDPAGNMLTDKNKGITTAITYNHLNLPALITRGAGNTVLYIYDANGRKLSQVTTFSSSQKNTDYAGDFHYEDDVLQFVSNEEGRIVFAGRELVYANNGDDISGTSSQSATVATNTGNGDQAYIEVVATAPSPRPEIVLGEVSVTAGNKYLVRLKGYRTGAAGNPVHICLKVDGDDSGWPGATFANTRTTESWTEQFITIPTGAARFSFGAAWGTNVTAGDSLFINDVQVLKLTSTEPEYQYHFKDHLGNVRMTFTTKKERSTATATLEETNAVNEAGEFLRYDKVRKIRSPLFDHSNGSSPGTMPGYAQRLNGTKDERVGLAKSLSVMPGDTVRMEVFAKYVDPNPSTWNAALTTLMSYFIIPAGAPVATVVDASGYAGNGTLPVPWAQSPPTDDGEGPNAGLSYVMFDREFNPIFDPQQTNFVRLGDEPVEDGSDVPHERLFAEILVRQPGFLYVYLSNNEDTPLDVFFDDFRVEHAKGPVVQTQEYYPYGLTFNHVHRENSLSNSYQYNSKEHQDELDLGWLDFGARMYQSDIGRWLSVDPLADKMRRHSPYNYTFNNPVRFIDPDGMAPDDPGKPNNVLGQQVAALFDYFTGPASTEQKVETAIRTILPMSTLEVGLKTLDNLVGDGAHEISKEKYVDAAKEVVSLAPAILVGPSVRASSSATKSQTISNFTAQRAFYAGSGTEKMALKSGFQTIGQTRAGKNLMKTTAGMAWQPGSEAFKMWTRLSTTYAKGIPRGSTVNVFLNNPPQNGIWNTVEKPILRKRNIKIIENTSH